MATIRPLGRRPAVRPALAFAGLMLAAGVLLAQAPLPPGYDVAYLGPPLADPVMQHNKETYVLFGCAYCHGVNLVPRGEAPDLRRSAIVGGDVNANLIGRILRAGIPQTAKLSPMPQFSDLSDQQIAAIASWIHYARQQAQLADLQSPLDTIGRVAAGKTYFERSCASCHDVSREFSRIGAKYEVTALRAAVLEPEALAGPLSYAVERLHDETIAARNRHRALLESYLPQDVSDVVAYLQTLK
jgi:mono/diheme cytochrome c family protein